MPAVGTYDQYSAQMLDFSGERKSITFPVFEITAVSFPTYNTELGLFETALQAILLGTLARTTTSLVNVVSNARPADKDAQIETEMLVTFVDDVTEEPDSFRLTTVDYTAFNYADPPAGDNVIFSGAGATEATTDFVEAFEQVARSRAGNAVTITSMRVVR